MGSQLFLGHFDTDQINIHPEPTPTIGYLYFLENFGLRQGSKVFQSQKRKYKTQYCVPHSVRNAQSTLAICA